MTVLINFAAAKFINKMVILNYP